MTRMPGMVRMIMSGITVIFAHGLDGEQLFTLFPDSGLFHCGVPPKNPFRLTRNVSDRQLQGYD